MITLSYPRWWMGWGIPATACLGAYRAKGAASLAASYVNLERRATYDLALGVAPDWTAAGGWSFNGTDDCLNTGIVPDENTSIIVRIANSTGSTYCFGEAASGHGFSFHPSIGRWQWGNTFRDAGGSVASGVIALCGGGVGYLNGSYVTTVPTPTWTAGATAIYLGRRGNQPNYGDVDIICAAVYSIALSAAQVKALALVQSRL